MTTYTDRPWLKSYDQGVPSSLAPYPDHALHDLLRESARQNPGDDILLTSVRLPLVGRIGSTMSLAQLDRASDALGAALVAMGLRKSERVAIVLPTCAAFAIAYFAILKAGGVVAACNPTYPPTTMAEQINNCDARFAVVLSGAYSALKEVQAHTKLETIIVTNIKEYFPPLGRLMFSLAAEKASGQYLAGLEAPDLWLQRLLKQYDGRAPAVSVHAGDVAVFQYTGGTTGIGKGAMLTHGALVANIRQITAFSASLRQDDRVWTVLGALPMFHVYGMVAVLNLSVSTRQRIALVHNPRDVDDMVDVIAKYRPDTLPAVPAMLNALANHPRVKSGEVTFESLRYCGSGSAPLASAPQEDFEKLITVPIRQGFGISEASCSTHMAPLQGEAHKGSVGLPLPDIEARIVDLDRGMMDVPVGERGELVVRGPNLMLGYYKMSAETAYALRELDGKTWLYTGDIATMDEDGYFYIVDRKKDMGIIGGFKIYPGNIERVLKMHDAVLDTVVVSIPHPSKEGQEAVKAWVVLKPGHTAAEQELIDHCQQFLAPYEVPRRYAFVDRLPGTGYGKSLREELIQQEMRERGDVSTSN